MVNQNDVLYLRKYSLELVGKILNEFNGDMTIATISRKYKIPSQTVGYWIKHKKRGGVFEFDSKVAPKVDSKKSDVFHKTNVEDETSRNERTITTRSLSVKSLQEALKVAKVDMKVWEVDRHVVNYWEVTTKLKRFDTDGKRESDKAETYTNFQVKVWLKKKSPESVGIEMLLGEMKNHSVKIPESKKLSKSKKFSRELEISLTDLHLGLRCYEPEADIDWTPEQAEIFTMDILEELITLSKLYGKYERIIFPIGNDFLHTDYVFNTTTKGTVQPEADAWKNTFLKGEKLAIAIIERLRKECPVKIISVPGNHARHTEIAMAHILQAYYHNNKNIEFDITMSPYKFHHFGINLIGFEHGHSIKQQVRLAALMANETRLNGWQEARYCEWHLGDQHRKGSGRPAMFEEQGVSVEFLPGLVPSNEWHRIHGLNWQKRAGMAFVWDKKSGPIARFQVNVDNYTGKIM